MKRFAAKKGRDEKENTMNTETAKATIEDSLRKDIGPYFQKYPKLSAVTAIPRWDRYMGRFDMWIEETRASFDGKATIAIQDEVTKAFRKAATSIIRCLESLGRVSDGYVDYPGSYRYAGWRQPSRENQLLKDAIFADRQSAILKEKHNGHGRNVQV